VQLAYAIEAKGAPDRFDYDYPGSPIDTMARHPYDPQVVLGGVGVLRNLPEDVDAVVSMCRLRDEDIRTDMPHIEVRLIDRPEADENPHLDYVLLQAVRTIEQLRAQGRTVLTHCVGAFSRTPTMGALYGLRLRGVSAEQALSDVTAVLPGANPNRAFRAALRRAEQQRPAKAVAR
jgi:protein-tyrosine phosphatase